MGEITAVKERPILFSAPMVRAILDGRKTQTRRVCKFANEISAVARIGNSVPPVMSKVLVEANLCREFAGAK